MTRYEVNNYAVENLLAKIKTWEIAIPDLWIKCPEVVLTKKRLL